MISEYPNHRVRSWGKEEEKECMFVLDYNDEENYSIHILCIILILIKECVHQHKELSSWHPGGGAFVGPFVAVDQ
jgi:hypothetical protein